MARLEETIKTIVESIGKDLPVGIDQEVVELLEKVKFESSIGLVEPILPCPVKQQEAVSVLKGIEGSLANLLGKERFGEQNVTVNLDRALMYLNTVLFAATPALMKILPNTDYHDTFSNEYRFASTNIYKCKDGKFYHLHGSLNATPTFDMLGIPHNQNLNAAEAFAFIQEKVLEWNSSDIEKVSNEQYKQAGVTCLTREEFLESEHGQIIHAKPLWEVDSISEGKPQPITGTRNILDGVKVLSLGRAIAGPVIGRNLSEYGAQVLKVIGPHSPDGSAFQLDNIGQNSCFIDLKTEGGKSKLRELIKECDIFVQGYRPGALEKLGFGFKQVTEMVKDRGYGIVYVSENCYGNDGPLSYRSGWQQIADCVSGLAWKQGKALGLDEPVLPLLPISDYCCGVMGTCGALDGLWRRSKQGGSYHVTTSLTKYNDWVQDLGEYSADEMKELNEKFGVPYRHFDTMAALATKSLMGMIKRAPRLLEHLGCFEETPFSGQPVKYLKPVVQMSQTVNQFLIPPRPHGYDKAEYPTL